MIIFTAVTGRGKSPMLWRKFLPPFETLIVLLLASVLFSASAVSPSDLLSRPVSGVRNGSTNDVSRAFAANESGVVEGGVTDRGVSGQGENGDDTSAGSPGEYYDLIIKGGTVIDGTGRPGMISDVGIRDGKIRAVGNLAQARAGRMLDVAGLAVAPGFIDAHAHLNQTYREVPGATSALAQGITTTVNGNDGTSPLDIAAHLASLPPLGVNYIILIGQGKIRQSVMGWEKGPASPAQMETMKAHVRRAMEAGAFGMTTALEYYPGGYAQAEELTALLEPVREAGGFYATHIRYERNDPLNGLSEALAITAKAGVPLLVSHLKMVYPANWPLLPEALGMLRKARDAGRLVAANVYPYLAPDYGMMGVFLSEVLDELPPGRILIKSASSAAVQPYVGETLEAAALRSGEDPMLMGRRLLAAEGQDLPVVTLLAREQDLERILREPYMMIGSDAAPRPIYAGSEKASTIHPRAFGTFPRILGRYVRERGTLDLAAAVRMMTAVPAAWLGLHDRGLIAEDFWADLVVFDPQVVTDRSTWLNPQLYPQGIEFVLVNGKPAVERGRFADLKAGMILRRAQGSPTGLEPEAWWPERFNPPVEPGSPVNGGPGGGSESGDGAGKGGAGSGAETGANRTPAGSDADGDSSGSPASSALSTRLPWLRLTTGTILILLALAAFSASRLYTRGWKSVRKED
ncbi:MAG: D-aminoacylase [Firmicutes bacterium]|nr:D-aminoacylase [Bacillota bacterium]